MAISILETVDGAWTTTFVHVQGWTPHGPMALCPVGKLNLFKQYRAGFPRPLEGRMRLSCLLPFSLAGASTAYLLKAKKKCLE